MGPLSLRSLWRIRFHVWTISGRYISLLFCQHQRSVADHRMQRHRNSWFHFRLVSCCSELLFTFVFTFVEVSKFQHFLCSFGDSCSVADSGCLFKADVDSPIGPTSSLMNMQFLPTVCVPFILLLLKSKWYFSFVITFFVQCAGHSVLRWQQSRPDGAE